MVSLPVEDNEDISAIMFSELNVNEIGQGALIK